MKFLFTGTFNPFTLGHYSVYENACKLLGKENVYIGIASNLNKNNHISKNALKWQINSITNNIHIIPDDMLVSNFCKYNNINGIIRSMRNAIDLIYEMDMCNWNRKFGIETIFIPCSEGMEKISSSVLRELIKLDVNIEEYLPPIDLFRQRLINKNPKRVLVCGKIASGKSSFLNENYYNRYIDLDKIAKEIIPLYIRDKIKKAIEINSLNEVLEEMNIAAEIIYYYIMSSNVKLFEVSALGTYSYYLKDSILNKLYEDSFIINIEKYESNKNRELSEDFKNKILLIQKDPIIIDYSINTDILKFNKDNMESELPTLLNNSYNYEMEYR